MDLGAISARQSAPTDGAGKGTVTEYPDAFATSKQNSDAKGMFYQWGRKDPFTFATSSEVDGKYPVKIYTIDGVLIYQESNGSSNTDKQPVGGVIQSSNSATSLMETINSPVSHFGGWPNSSVNQIGHKKDLWDYYWTSYSRGIDGLGKWGDGSSYKPNSHNSYLNGYKSQRTKSIYDPCPYLYRVPSNGSYDDISTGSWVSHSYNGGINYTLNDNCTWMCTLGWRSFDKCLFSNVGYFAGFASSTPLSNVLGYSIDIRQKFNYFKFGWMHTSSQSVRCIEGLCSSVRPDRRTRSFCRWGFLYQ